MIDRGYDEPPIRKDGLSERGWSGQNLIGYCSRCKRQKAHLFMGYGAQTVCRSCLDEATGGRVVPEHQGRSQDAQALLEKDVSPAPPEFAALMAAMWGVSRQEAIHILNHQKFDSHCSYCWAQVDS